METETGNRSRKTSKNEEEMEQWEDSVSSYSSVSSMSSDSSEGHIILGKNIPRPTSYMSAPGPQRKESSTMVFAVGSSQPGLSSSSQHNQLMGMPGYDPNRIPSSVFSSKGTNAMDWSLASNESLFSLHTGNFSFSGDQALAAVLRSAELPKMDEFVNLKIDSNPVPRPVKESKSLEKKPEKVKNLTQEKSDSESDDEDTEEEGEEIINPDSQDEPETLAETQKQEEEEDEDDDEAEEEVEEEEGVAEEEPLTKKGKQYKEEEDEKEGEDDDDDEEEDDGDTEDDGKGKGMKPTNPTQVFHSTSISCRSDTSNNSNCSFAFPVLENEDGGVKTPSMQIHKDGCKNSRAHEELPQSRMQQQQQQPPQSLLLPQPYPQSQAHALPQPQPQWKSSKQEGQPQSPKAPRFRWFSCFYFPLRCC